MITLNFKYSVVFFSAGVILILFLIIIDVPIVPAIQQTSDSPNQIQDETQSKEDILAQTKSIDHMDCTELNQFITSFEKGWGNAILMYNENCT